MSKFQNTAKYDPREETIKSALQSEILDYFPFKIDKL